MQTYKVEKKGELDYYWNTLNWVLKARNQKKTYVGSSQEAFWYLWVVVEPDQKIKSLICTDGHRMHIYSYQNNNDFKAGMYTVKKAKDCVFLSTIEGDHPDYHAIVPSRPLKELTTINYWEGEKKTIHKVQACSKLVALLAKGTEGIYFNYEYVYDALLPGSVIFVVDTSPYQCPIRMVTEHTMSRGLEMTQAYIMPAVLGD